MSENKIWDISYLESKEDTVHESLNNPKTVTVKKTIPCTICEHPFVYNIHWIKINSPIVHTSFPLCTHCKQHWIKVGLFDRLFIEVNDGVL